MKLLFVLEYFLEIDILGEEEPEMEEFETWEWLLKSCCDARACGTSTTSVSSNFSLEINSTVESKTGEV